MHVHLHIRTNADTFTHKHRGSDKLKKHHTHIYTVLQVKTNLLQSHFHLKKKQSHSVLKNENCSQNEEVKPRGFTQCCFHKLFLFKSQTANFSEIIDTTFTIDFEMA